MEQVEEICEQIILINDGKSILNGHVAEIKEQYKDHIFRYSFEGELDDSLLENVNVRNRQNGTIVINLPTTLEANSFMKTMMDNGMVIREFVEILPTLNDIFIKKVTEKDG